MRAAIYVSVGLLSCLALLAVSWLGGEIHYRNCLNAVELRYPVAYRQATSETNLNFKIGPQPGFDFYNQAGRDNAIDSCSRWPF
jgi:hypothetical protein